jgi:hypothetical protein
LPDQGEEFRKARPETKVHEAQISQGFAVYPNPANDNVCFNVDDKYIGGRLLIYDLLGNIVMSQALQGSKVNLNVDGLSSGTYLFSINGVENTDGTKKGKITISH